MSLAQKRLRDLTDPTLPSPAVRRVRRSRTDHSFRTRTHHRALLRKIERVERSNAKTKAVLWIGLGAAVALAAVFGPEVMARLTPVIHSTAADLTPPPSPEPAAGRKDSESKAAATDRPQRKPRPQARTSAPLTPAADEPMADPSSAEKPSRMRLTVKHVIAGIDSQSRPVERCIDRAHRRGELADGVYRVRLNLNIAADGHVSAAQVVAPEALAGGRFARCFEAAMARWTFPPSASGLRLDDFPFGAFRVQGAVP